MSVDDLRKRLLRFRQAYLDTAEGRAHLQKELDEPKEVQAIFRDLCQHKEVGEDITDDVLEHLLPHQDTENNRTRGVRISTWPCVTKNVKMWFEGAKWKTPKEWPATAEWLLAICQAGKSEDWVRWQSLVSQPSQKGFACGFITPIVHCLNSKLPVINSKVVKTYEAVAEEMGVDTKISSALEEYPENQRLLVELVTKLKGFGIDGLREWDIYCHWNVAKRLGGSLGTPTPPTQPLEKPKPEQPVSSIVKELRDTQHDTKHPDCYEAAIAVAFQALGFETEHIGGPGEADVVARAMLGDESYCVVLDAKTCPEGGTRGNFNYDPLKKHQEQHEAEFAVVVAPAFPHGDTVTHAISRSVGLLTTDQLISLVDESEERGISLFVLKDILGRYGVISVNLAEYRGIRDDLVAAAFAVLEIFEVHQRADESSTGLESRSVYWLLKGRGGKFFQKHVDEAVQLLANPLLGILEAKGEGFVLTLPAAKASKRIRSVGTAFDQLIKAAQTGSAE